MQLLFQRSLQASRMKANRLHFVLWAKFELDDDELRLIHKFCASDAYLTIEHSRRDLYRALIFAFVSALFLCVLLMNTMQTDAMGALMVFPIIFALLTWVLFEQIRKAIRISDMLRGRNFKNRSLALLVQRERRMVGYAAAFIHLLEALRTWEGTEVIRIGPEHEPALRLVTDTYAPT